MIPYLDASALIKRYAFEFGSDLLNQVVDQADLAGTSLVSRAEVAAALAKSVRVRILSREEGSG